MSDLAISVENLSKTFVFANDRAASLREVFDAPFRRLIGRTTRRVTIEALKDVSFEVPAGEGFGVIGRNGAGKTTLLSILSGITTPTSGRALIRGRVGALLGVGTGFHPQLTGRENVYLNGAVLGMRAAEVQRLYDQIVEFSEIERFIDVPVKRYSSGMQARLAFSIAAHLDPEVLMLDEVLAVGDRHFKEKCHARVDEITNDGRTVLLVSHDMGSVLRMCEQAVILERGEVAFFGTSADATAKYATMGAALEPGERAGSGELRIANVLISGSAGDCAVHIDGELRIAVELECTQPADPTGLRLKLGVHARRGVLGQLSTQAESGALFDREVQSGDVLTCDVARVPLKPGEYWLSARLERMGELVDEVDRCGSFWVVAGEGEFGIPPSEGDPGFIALRHRWTVSEPLQPV